MTSFFGFFGSIFGYVLWAAFLLVKNFGLAIILFTILMKGILFPFSVKQQKSMAASARLQAKQRELQKKYANDKQKYNEEFQKLYQKEGVSPTGGCLTSIVPLFVMLGLYYSVVMPLSNTLHVAKDALQSLKTVPGISTVVYEFVGSSSIYSEISVIGKFKELSPILKETFSLKDFTNIEMFSNPDSFNVLGLNLLQTPKAQGLSWLLIIPVLCLLTSWVSQFFTTKLNGSAMQQQQGCMKYMLYAMPLLTAYIAWTVPAAVGFYWIISTILGFLQTLLLHKFYSPAIMTAKAEAQRVALLEQEEKLIR